MVVGLVALAGGSGAVALAMADAPRARLTSYLCQTALDPAERAISVTAVMRPVSGTGKMAMRFQLIKRTHRYSRPVALAGTDLNSWLTPKNPTLGSRPGDRWVVKHPVVDLAGPDFYRFKVAFRWSDASGHVIGRAVRSSPLCFQPERRPDLEVVNDHRHRACRRAGRVFRSDPERGQDCLRVIPGAVLRRRVGGHDDQDGAAAAPAPPARRPFQGAGVQRRGAGDDHCRSRPPDRREQPCQQRDDDDLRGRHAGPRALTGATGER